MYSEHLEKLIEFALIDGELSDKERIILIKTAINEGIDQDEFEMVLDARIFQISKNNSTIETNIISGKTISNDFEKCPACNDFYPQFSTNCISCGFEINSISFGSVIKDLLTKLEEFDQPKTGRNNALLEAFSNDSNTDTSSVAQKCEMIMNCTVPNSKSEILSFLSIAIPFARQAVKKLSFYERHLKPEVSKDKISNAWKFKCEQIIVQSRFSMKEDIKILNEINKYAKELNIK